MNQTWHFLLSKLTKPNISKPNITTPRIRKSFSVGPGGPWGEMWTFSIIFPQEPLFWISCSRKLHFYISPKNLIFGAKLSTFTLWCQIVHGAKLSTVPNCPWCQIVHFYPWCQIVLVPNCPRCQIVRGAKLSTFTLWCQIVRQHGRCQIVRGAKLSWCQIVLGPYNYILWM